MRARVLSSTALVVVLLCGAFGFSITPAQASGSGGPDGTKWYLPLGDSLAAGAEQIGDPLSNTPDKYTSYGYTDDLWHLIDNCVPTAGLNDDPGNLEWNGCSKPVLYPASLSSGRGKFACLDDINGETTRSFIEPGRTTCTKYSTESQLQAAVRFLKRHRGHVGLITIDVGADDLGLCITSDGKIKDLKKTEHGFESSCVANKLADVKKNIKTIADGLRDAAPGVKIIGGTYYNAMSVMHDVWANKWHVAENWTPELVTFANDKVKELNNILIDAYRANGIKVARVDQAFHIDHHDAQVKDVCNWTRMCNDFPPDVHPNGSGYLEIERAFAEQY